MRYQLDSEMIEFGPEGKDVQAKSIIDFMPKHNLLKTYGPIKHNFKIRKAGLFKVSSGDIIETEDLKLTIKDDLQIELEGEYTTNLLSANLIKSGYSDYPEYTNSPRVHKQILDTKVDLERIPEKDKDTSTSSLVKKLLPASVGIIMAVLMLWVRPRGVRGILMLITTLVSFGISMYTLYTDRRDGNAHNKLRKETYDMYLQDKRDELAVLKINERTSRNFNFIDFKQIIKELDHTSSRLYERDINDEDFMKLRMGTKTEEPTYQMTNPFEKLELRYEDADEQLKQLYEEYKQVEGVPLVIDGTYNIGLVGNRYVISKQMKNLLLQSIFNHSYLDLQIVIITDDTYLYDYQYAFTMGHFQTEDKSHNLFIHNSTSRDQFLNGFTSILRQRDMDYKQGMKYSKHYMFIIDNPSLVNNHPIMEFLEKPEARLGMSIVQVANDRQELPKHIKTVIEYKTEEKADLILENGSLINKEFKLPQITKSKEELEIYYRRLSNLEHIKGIKSNVPDKLGFLEMYDVTSPSQLNISQRWNTNKTYKSLAALLGKKSATDDIYLDLHEKIHGPHGLIAGTTGSGKSEVIQTYILSLAIEYSPEQVGFLLIDYKGGGMANLFKDMPHHLGSITNLDGYQSMRALASIKSELKRRQQIFSDNNVNHINNYTKLYEDGDVIEPLPHLFLISDEFAELKAEQPDFMKELVSAARIGRSLGIHLILATQKPDGVVDDQIWSNSKFKLSLKVAEEADSKALLKTPDAAYITNPGRGYLKVGTNELYELFQSGYSGAPYVESLDGTDTINPEVYVVDMYGNKTLLNPEECITETEQEGIQDTELDVVLHSIDTVYKQSNLIEVRKPWLPPLENYVYEEKIVGMNGKLCVKLGTIDLPSQQIQLPYIIDFEENGHLLVVGNSGMGKTYSILTTIFRLAYQNSVADLKLFVFDISNAGLVHLKDLKHLSEYFTLDYDEKQKQFCDYMLKEVSSRKQHLLEARANTFKTYNLSSSQKMQSIFIVIDSYDNISELDEDVVNCLKMLIKEGPSVGIFLLISTSTSTNIKQKELLYFKNILLLHTATPEVSQLLKKTTLPAQEIPGRGFTLHEEVEVVQINAPIPNCEEVEKNQEFNKIITAINLLQEAENSAFATMPNNLKYKKYNYKIEKDRIYVGNAYANLKPTSIPLESIHISGINKSGKTNFLKLIIEQIKTVKKISILDDTSYSLLEYSETKGINYTTNPDGIDVNSEVVVINKTSRFDKLKAKDLAPILEKLFLMHLKGTVFIVETDSKGLKAGKVDIWTAIVSSKYYMHFGNPILQDKYPVEKKKFKKEIFQVSEAYLTTDTSINKIKIPKVITGNEDKKFIIPELKELEVNEVPDIIEGIVVGDNKHQYINSIIEKNPSTQFKQLGTALQFSCANWQRIKHNEISNMAKDEVLIIASLEELNNMKTDPRRVAHDALKTFEGKIIITAEQKIKLSGDRLRTNKRRFIVTSNPAKEEIQELCRPMPSSAKKLVLHQHEAIKVDGKDVQKIRY